MPIFCSSLKNKNRFCITICLIFFKRASDIFFLMNIISSKTKKEILSYLPNKETTEVLSRFFSSFADGTRLLVLSAVSIKKMCVSDIADVCGLNQTTVSHQLKILKNEGILKSERQGKIVFYSVKDPKINQVLLLGVEYCV